MIGNIPRNITFPPLPAFRSPFLPGFTHSRHFPANFVKFLRVPLLQNNSGRLLQHRRKVNKKSKDNKYSRSSHQRCSIKKGVLRNFAKFTGKHLCRSLFLIKLQALWHRCFSVNFAKFLETPFYRIPLDDCFLYSMIEARSAGSKDVFKTL